VTKTAPGVYAVDQADVTVAHATAGVAIGAVSLDLANSATVNQDYLKSATISLTLTSA
jgi:hypothetical protein